MSGAIAVFAWWLAFAGGHLFLSSIPVRTPLIRRLGARGFQGLYSLVALVTFIGLVTVWWRNHHGGELLWNLRGVPGMQALVIGLNVLAFAFLFVSFFNPSPVSVGGSAGAAHGALRITRHPLLAGFGLWSLGHLLVNGWVTDVIFFGGILLFTLVGAAHQDARKRATEADLGPLYAETSLLPFVAIAQGRNRLVLGEIPWVGAGLGVLAAGLLWVFHDRLFG